MLLRRFPEAIALRRRAATAPRHAFDAAIAMLRYGGEIEEARALLATRDGAPLTEIERIWSTYANGLLALADAEHETALALFDASLAIAHVALTDPSSLFSRRVFIDAHRALAHAALGDREYRG